MGEIIKKFTDGSFLEYGRGSFDDWCVYLTDSAGVRKPPRDTAYFEQLKNLAGKYGTDRIYADYVRVYNLTKKELDPRVLKSISDIAESYDGDALSMDTILSILYMAMIAEEKKAYTKLGKRIKRLGIYMLLKEKRSVSDSANFMRGMGWREIDELCKERGF